MTQIRRLALLTREQAQMRRVEFLNSTNNEVDMGIIGVKGRIELLRSNAELLDIPVDKLLPTAEEYMKQKAEEAKTNPPPQDPKIVEIQQKGEMKNAEMQQDGEQFKMKLAAESEANAAANQLELEKHRETLDMEFKLKIRMLDEESRQKELDRALEREQQNNDKDNEVTRIREESKLKREGAAAENSKEPAPQAPAPVINLTIDNQKGLVKKKIDLTTGKNGALSGATVTEEEIGEEK